MFDRGGVPVRATVSVSFKGHRILEEESAGAQGGESEGSGSGQRTKTHQVTQGDTLWDIAGAEYGDPQQWRRIADANGIENPRTLQAGQVLTIPPAGA
jgi:nucleoid-associated protein YgaU